MSLKKELEESIKRFKDQVVDLKELLGAYKIDGLQKMKTVYSEDPNFRKKWFEVWSKIAHENKGKLGLGTAGALLGAALGGVGIAALGGAIGLPLFAVLGLAGFVVGTEADANAREIPKQEVKEKPLESQSAGFHHGDQVVHQITQEEGIVKSLHILRIGTNAVECILVTVGREDKVWLSDQTSNIDTPAAAVPHHQHKDVPHMPDPGNPIKTLGEISVRTSPTSSPTIPPTATYTPTPTPPFSLLAEARPNIIKNGETVDFLVNLKQNGQINLSIFTVLGESVYQTTFNGNSGLNSYSWKLQNQAGGSLASGLYIYLIQADYGSSREQQTGKIVLLH